MPFASYLDPSILEFDFIERILADIEKFVKDKRREVEKSFNKWESENRNVGEENKEWYQAMEDNFVDEGYFVSELERNLLSGLGVTINTIFERHVSIFVREMSKLSRQISFNNRHTYG